MRLFLLFVVGDVVWNVVRAARRRGNAREPNDTAPAVEAAPLCPVSLPSALVVNIFRRVPLDSRLLARGVSLSWRVALDVHEALWQDLDVSVASGVAEQHSHFALLQAAAARLKGGVTSIATTGCPRISDLSLLSVCRHNALLLRELRCSSLNRSPRVVRVLCEAAPWLEIIETGVTCSADELVPLLGSLPEDLRLVVPSLTIESPNPTGELGSRTAILSAASGLLSLRDAQVQNVAFDCVNIGSMIPETLDALSSALVQLPSLTALVMDKACLSSASAMFLARLLRGCNRLSRLHIKNGSFTPSPNALFDRPAEAMVAAALAEATLLESLMLVQCNLFARGGGALILEAASHLPFLSSLDLDGNRIDDTDEASCESAGRALALFVRASSSLKKLLIHGCGLQIGLIRLYQALPSSRLQILHIHDNNWPGSTAEIDWLLLLTVRATPSLRELCADAGFGAVALVNTRTQQPLPPPPPPPPPPPAQPR